jgi:RNA polymerase sigma-70 factor (ECF subfamily)
VRNRWVQTTCPARSEPATACSTGRWDASWQTPTKPWLDSLPRDPKALLDRIYRDSKGAGNSKHGQAVVVIADVLRSGFVPGDLRAALFRAATLVPGVEVLDGQAVLDGRRGVSIGRYETVNGLRQEVVFDPATGQVIGERQVAVKPKADFRVPPGAVVSSTAVETDVVATAP